MKEVGFGTLNWVAVIIYITSYVVHSHLYQVEQAKVPIVSLPQVVACHLG
ncbi:hypothetical protein ACVPOR_15455 [Staphylococcus aureus]